MKKHVIVIGSKNKGKIKEIKEILDGQPVEILDLAEFGQIPEPAENEETFEDNAYQKALYYARNLGWPVLADDSGLAVEALNGRPGVYSARYAGEGASDQDRCRKILEELQGEHNRKASFICALVLAIPSGPGLTWVGSCEGEIALEPIGINGFGYDPIFYYPELKKTFGQITSEEKGRISHRGQALREFQSEFPKVLKWLDMRTREITSQYH